MDKLLEFQKKVGAIVKDQTNPHFKNTYFNINTLLAEIKPILNELGLVLIQPLEVREDKNCIASYLWDKDKLLFESRIYLPDIQDPQKIGSAISYYRRYSIQSMLLLQAEDDDANLASSKEPISYHNEPQTNQTNKW